ncbi:hypothetical protein EDD22DRAFT_1007232 [Suillus occidentalis]|nr:hypothetical protein EDD22DRAFT_1007232 [Suillus occidentalis]
MASTSDAALKKNRPANSHEDAINQHKLTQQSVGFFFAPRSNAKVETASILWTLQISETSNKVHSPAHKTTLPSQASSTRDVVIDGMTFEPSNRSLVRKDLPKRKALLRSIPQQVDFPRTTTGLLIPTGRAHKPKASSRPRPRRPRDRNMTLDNARDSQQRGRECLDFAEAGSCSTKGRKLSHVVRTNCKRKLLAPTASLTPDIAATVSSNVISGCDTSSDNVLSSQHVDDAIQHLLYFFDTRLIV